MKEGRQDIPNSWSQTTDVFDDHLFVICSQRLRHKAGTSTIHVFHYLYERRALKHCSLLMNEDDSSPCMVILMMRRHT